MRSQLFTRRGARGAVPPVAPVSIHPKRHIDFAAWASVLVTILLAYVAWEAWKEAQVTTHIFQGQLAEAQKQSRVIQDQLEEARNQSVSVQAQIEEARKQSSAALAQLEEVKKQSIAAQEQINVARAAQRPWITADVEAASGFRPAYDNSYLLNFAIKLRNIGHAPAQSVVTAFGYYFGKDDDGPSDSELTKAQQKVCKRPERTSGVFQGSTIFPDQKSAQDNAVFIPAEEWKSAASTRVVVYIVGCVIYYFADDHVDHTTRFTYYVSGKDKNRALPRDPTTVRQADIDLMQVGIADLFLAD